MGEIPFTKFVRPHGTQRPVGVNVDDNLAKLARTIIEMGYEFHIEALGGGLVSMTVASSSDIDDEIAAEIGPNGPGIHDTVRELVMSATTALTQRA